MIKHDIATHQSNLIMFVTIHSIHHHHPIQSLLLLYPHHRLFFSLSLPTPQFFFTPINIITNHASFTLETQYGTDEKNTYMYTWGEEGNWSC